MKPVPFGGAGFTGICPVRSADLPPLLWLILAGLLVFVVWHFWPYLVTGLALIGVYHLWTHYHPK